MSGGIDQKPFLPYGRQIIDEDDIRAVVEVLRSDWLTTGPKVAQFERAFASAVGAEHAVAVSSGTAALHAAMHALDIGPGDEVIVPAITFVATANCVVYQGGIPVFADVESDTLLLDRGDVQGKITPATKAIIAMDYGGQPCDYDELRTLADRHGLALVADACHSLGGVYRGRSVGTLADLTVFSLHPLKHITTGEGGMIACGQAEAAERMRRFRNHGINSDHRQRSEQGTWSYAMEELGFNYRLTDMQCALGVSQLAKLDRWLARRREIAAMYDRLLAGMKGVTPLLTKEGRRHAHHLYVIKTAAQRREMLFERLRAARIGVNVHYEPVHLHPFYRSRFATAPGMCPVAEEVAARLLSLPMQAAMTGHDAERVVEELAVALGEPA